MKTLFYPRLAWDGLRKNRRMVFPYILTCISMISMFYILAFLSTPETVALLPRGGNSATLIMTLGSYVIAIFSVIFLYYTNSFLIRRRASEFGLYNVLGMGKRNLARILTMESLMTSAISIAAGLLLGIAFSKLAELGLIKAIGGTVSYDLRVDMACVRNTVIFYLAIFAVIWLSSIIRVSCSSTVSLLKSEKAGEKAPKANWLLGILGAVLLGAAYYIAVFFENPIEAILWFFLAVIMVIIATYLLMIAGSVLLCRILQKNKKYYYDPRHFVSVSSMVYRMKRNGAGLASIAIISTMVLVMISSSSCLWFGTKDMIHDRYPAELNITMRFFKGGLPDEERLDAFKKSIEDFAAENRTETETVLDLPYVEMTGIGEQNAVYLGIDERNTLAVNKIRDVCLIPVSAYNRETGQYITLEAEEALAFTSGFRTDVDTVDLILDGHIRTFRLLESDEKKFYAENNMNNIVPRMYLIIPDLDSAMAALGETQEDGRSHASYIWKYCIDVKQSSISETDLAEGIRTAIKTVMEKGRENDSDQEKDVVYSIMIEDRETGSADYFSTTGSLFFIGIILSAVFILAAVLIIYYKQISEGYEDSSRFEVMRKVGMTGDEIKKSINSQLLVVFFIPLVFAGLHLIFAFPMIERILLLLGLHSNSFFTWTLISFAAFAVFYAIVYKITSNVYYHIVSDAK